MVHNVHKLCVANWNLESIVVSRLKRGLIHGLARYRSVHYGVGWFILFYTVVDFHCSDFASVCMVRFMAILIRYRMTECAWWTDTTRMIQSSRLPSGNQNHPRQIDRQGQHDPHKSSTLATSRRLTNELRSHHQGTTKWPSRLAARSTVCKSD